MADDFNFENCNAYLDLNLGDKQARVSDLNINLLFEDQNIRVDGAPNGNRKFFRSK